MFSPEFEESLKNLNTFCQMLQKDYTKCTEKNTFKKYCFEESKNLTMCLEQYLLLSNICALSQNWKPKKEIDGSRHK